MRKIKRRTYKMLETIKHNVYQNGTVLLKTKGISKYTNCDYCGDKLSGFSKIHLCNPDDGNCEVRGKLCPTCGIIYVPYSIPDMVTDTLSSIFGKKIDIEDNPYNEQNGKDDQYNGHKSISKYASGNSHPMGKAGRQKSYTDKM